MKVYEGQGSVLQPAHKNMNKKGPKESDFQQIMDQTRLQPEKKGDLALYGNLEPVADGIHIHHGAEKINEPLKMVGREQVMEEIKQALDIIDFYAAKLADSSLSISGITPLIGHLEDKMETLRSMASTPGMPEKLRPIISDMVITIGTEIAKFRRGDYS